MVEESENNMEELVELGKEMNRDHSGAVFNVAGQRVYLDLKNTLIKHEPTR